MLCDITVLLVIWLLVKCCLCLKEVQYQKELDERSCEVMCGTISWLVAPWSLGITNSDC